MLSRTSDAAPRWDSAHGCCMPGVYNQPGDHIGDPLTVDQIKALPDGADHVVTGFSEVEIRCGACGVIWEQPINPRERLSHMVCPLCNHAAITRITWNLADEYEPREAA